MKKIFSLFVLIGFFIVAPTALAATITVNSGDDTEISADGLCTLREAVENANTDSDTTGGDCVAGSGVDTIVFSEPLTVALSAGTITITDQVIIDGAANGVGVCSTKSLGVFIDGTLSPIVTAFSITSGASGSTIKGLVIGNVAEAIVIDGSNNNTIHCNIIGLDTTGNALAANSGVGITVDGGSGNKIGGIGTGEGNVISGNATGMELYQADATEIYGNIIGLNVDGTSAFDQQDRAITIADSDGVIIGGATSARRNIIAGSQYSENSSGLTVHGLVTNLTIEGNYFGTDVTGLVNIKNIGHNILFCDESICGSPDEGTVSQVLIKNNIFGGNNVDINEDVFFPVVIFGSSSVADVTIQGNFFGIGADGETLIGSSLQQWVDAVNVEGLTIGGSQPGERNIFAGNNSFGAIHVHESSDVSIIGNKIGVLDDGVTTSGTFFATTVSVRDVENLTFGEAVANGGNIITGSTDPSEAEFAVELQFITGNSTFQNNRIGVTADDEIVESAGSGMNITVSEGVVFGGLNQYERNSIAGFEQVGVFILVSDASLVGNNIYNNGSGIIIGDTSLAPSASSLVTLLQNSIYNNETAIDLAQDLDGDTLPEVSTGPTPNDPGDTDTGPNHYLNTPIIHSVDITGLTTYSVDVPAGTYRIEFFAGSGVNQAADYVSYDTFVSTGSSKQQTITLDLSGLDNDDHISATTTEDLGSDTYGATSELSQEYVPLAQPKRRTVSGTVSPEYLAQQGIVLDQSSRPSTSSSTTSASCPADQILTQNMRAGARNGTYHPYTKAIVTEVKILQAHMNRLGFNSGSVDGILGPITDGAIKRMQTFLGTKADGMIGPITRGLINSSCGSEGLKKRL